MCVFALDVIVNIELHLYIHLFAKFFLIPALFCYSHLPGTCPIVANTQRRMRECMRVYVRVRLQVCVCTHRVWKCHSQLLIVKRSDWKTNKQKSRVISLSAIGEDRKRFNNLHVLRKRFSSSSAAASRLCLPDRYTN